MASELRRQRRQERLALRRFERGVLAREEIVDDIGEPDPWFHDLLEAIVDAELHLFNRGAS